MDLFRGAFRPGLRSEPSRGDEGHPRGPRGLRRGEGSVSGSFLPPVRTFSLPQPLDVPTLSVAQARRCFLSLSC
eukprot:2227208-Pyramimonas_sp.AAC.1